MAVGRVCDRLRPSALEAMWRRLPADAPLREAATAVACGTHSRLGRTSPLSALSDLPEMVHAIMMAVTSAPLVVPDDHATLDEAARAAIAGQTILVRPGKHALTVGTGMATKLEKELHVVGQPGAVLVGGLHMGMESSGSVASIDVLGHVWVYDGRWDISGCRICNNQQDAAVVVSNLAQATFQECEIGGLANTRSRHGLIQYGDSTVCVRDSEITYCRLAVTLGNQCKCYIVGCDLKDSDVIFACMQGDTGIHLEVADSEIARSGVVWKDGRRPPKVLSRGNTVQRNSLGPSYWTTGTPWGSWGTLGESSDVLVDGDCVIGDDLDSVRDDMVDLHPEAALTDVAGRDVCASVPRRAPRPAPDMDTSDTDSDMDTDNL